MDVLAAIMGNHPVAKQQPPLFWRPIWHVAHLVYQGGNPILKRSSLAGGGFLPQRDLAGKEQPGWQPYATPVISAVGSGFLASRVNFLTALSGGQSTTQF
jgi:hypothetical protein